MAGNGSVMPSKSLHPMFTLKHAKDGRKAIIFGNSIIFEYRPATREIYLNSIVGGTEFRSDHVKKAMNYGLEVVAAVSYKVVKSKVWVVYGGNGQQIEYKSGMKLVKPSYEE